MTQLSFLCYTTIQVLPQFTDGMMISLLVTWAIMLNKMIPFILVIKCLNLSLNCIKSICIHLALSSCDQSLQIYNETIRTNDKF